MNPAFVKAHDSCNSFTTVVPEDNQAMTGTYLMVDPGGRFNTNFGGRTTSSSPILEVGWERALAELPRLDIARFEERGGKYDW